MSEKNVSPHLANSFATPAVYSDSKSSKTQSQQPEKEEHTEERQSTVSTATPTESSGVSPQTKNQHQISQHHPSHSNHHQLHHHHHHHHPQQQQQQQQQHTIPNPHHHHHHHHHHLLHNHHHHHHPIQNPHHHHHHTMSDPHHHHQMHSSAQPAVYSSKSANSSVISSVSPPTNTSKESSTNQMELPISNLARSKPVSSGMTLSVLERQSPVGVSRKRKEKIMNKEKEKEKEKKKKKQKCGYPSLDVEPINQLILETCPHRRFLGSIIYNPTTTWETLQTETLYGLEPELQQRFQEIKQVYIQRESALKNDGASIDAGMALSSMSQTRYIPCIPPLPLQYINSVVEIIVPFRHIIWFKQDMRNEIVQRKRIVWGGASGVYTDDSDILYVLMHMGFFNQDENDDEGEELETEMDLGVWNKNQRYKKEGEEQNCGDKVIRPMNLLRAGSNNNNNNNKDVGDGEISGIEEIIVEGDKSERKLGNGECIEDEAVGNNDEKGTKYLEQRCIDKGVVGDLSVEVLLLPPLPQYYGYFRNGINSRSWNVDDECVANEHSGLSMAVYSVKWLSRGAFARYRQFDKWHLKENEANIKDQEELIRVSQGWKFASKKQLKK